MRIVTVLLVCLMALVNMQCTAKVKVIKQSSDFKTWAITHVESGGIDGRHLVFSINSTGTIVFEDRRAKASAEMKTDNAETFAQIGDLLRRLDLPNAERKPKEKPDCEGCSDQVRNSFTIKLDERDYDPDVLDLSDSRASDYGLLLSVYREINEKNEKTLMNKAAELKVKNAKTVSITIYDAKYKPAWQGKFSRKGESNIFEGEWKNNETAETLRDKVELVLNGRTVNITRTGAGEVAVPKEFQGNWDGYSPGFIGKSLSKNEINWDARFE